VLPVRRAPAHLDPAAATSARGWAVVLFIILLLLPAAAALADGVPQITGLRFGLQEGGRTRIVLDSDRDLVFDARAMEEPWRLVIDLPQLVWNPQPGPQNRARGLARAHRFGALPGDRSQLVIDASGPFRIRAAMLLPPSEVSRYYRLVVDLEPVEGGIAARARAVALARDGNATAATPRPMAPAAPPPAEPAAVASASPEPPAHVVALPHAAGNGHRILSKPPAPPRALDSIDPRPVIVLDAGHGGLDPGAIGVNGMYEKDLTLAMARQLRGLIEASGRYRAAMTRDADIFIPLRERMRLGRESGGSLFISLHADVLGQEQTRGASVYTLSETASDDEAARLASKENKADIIVGADLSNHDAVVASILIDLAQRETNNRSIEFADTLSAELARVTPLLRKHRRFAGFAVLKSPDLPSVLVELGYISNHEDAQNLADAAYRDKVARAVLTALDRYFAGSRS
jgi:N-acetylmuramoyl-L-alanine amidase